MSINKLIVNKTLLMCLVTTVSLNAIASGFKKISYDHLEIYLTHICVVDVERIERKENSLTFLSGKVIHLSDTVTVTGKVQQSFKGECGFGAFKTQYTTPVTTRYDELGQKIGGSTFLLTETGLELEVQPATTYAFSYMSFDKENEIHQHVRVDDIESLLNLNAAIKNPNTPEP